MIWAGLCIAVLVAVSLNRLAAGSFFKPRPGLVEDVFPALCVSLLYFGALLLTARPVFSLLLAAGGAILLWAVNKVKKELFHEPLTFMDLFLVPQIVRHHRFYLPYLFPLKVLLPLLGCLGIMAMILILEPPAVSSRLTSAYILMVLLLLLGGGLLLFSTRSKGGAEAILHNHPLSLGPQEDIQSYGLLGAGFLQALWHRHLRGKARLPGISRALKSPPEYIVWPRSSLKPIKVQTAPHIIAIQAESFYDLRTLHPDIEPRMLQNYDRLSRQSCSGKLRVFSHGAYTMRTEFAVLTGSPPGSLGTDSLNPFHEIARRPAWSMAWHLYREGYNTEFVHPFDLTFFQRHRVMPNLGFQKLMGARAFDQEDRFGPYISDMALGKYIFRSLQESRAPKFIFGVSIEAHGPWDGTRYSLLPPGPRPCMPEWGNTQLEIYIRHLKNTDQMLGYLARHLSQLSRPVILCIYGDHPGSLPGIYSQTDKEGPYTPYLLWSTAWKGRQGCKIDLLPQELGGKILTAALENAAAKNHFAGVRGQESGFMGQ